MTQALILFTKNVADDIFSGVKLMPERKWYDWIKQIQADFSHLTWS